MKNLLLAAFIALGFSPLISAQAFARDVHVNGYSRKDGTYVRPHIRSAPDGIRSNNYGPSEDSYQLMNPTSRDYDHDGISNYQDRDDDNDGTSDNNDSSQYNLNR